MSNEKLIEQGKTDARNHLPPRDDFSIFYLVGYLAVNSDSKLASQWFERAAVREAEEDRAWDEFLAEGIQPRELI